MHSLYNITQRKKLNQKEKIFSKLHKENNKDNKNSLTFLIFYLLSQFFFFSDIIFCKRGLILHHVHTFIMLEMLILESILEYISQKNF